MLVKQKRKKRKRTAFSKKLSFSTILVFGGPLWAAIAISDGSRQHLVVLGLSVFVIVGCVAAVSMQHKVFGPSEIPERAHIRRRREAGISDDDIDKLLKKRA